MGLLASLAQLYQHEFVTSGPVPTDVLQMDPSRISEYCLETQKVPGGEANVYRHSYNASNGLGRSTAIAIRIPKPKSEYVSGVRMKFVRAPDSLSFILVFIF